MDNFSQNPNPQSPVVGGYAPMSNQEILYRTMAGVAPVAAHMLGNRRGIGGSIAGLGAGLAGAYGGAMAQDLAAQRMDPVAQQLRVAQQLQDLGTKPLAPTPLPADTTFSMPAAGQPTLPPAPLTPGPGIAGQPTFNVANIPERERIAFAKDIAPIQQYETAKAQEAYVKAHQGLVEAQKAEITGLPTAEAAVAGLPAKLADLPEGVDINQKIQGGGTVAFKSPSELEKERKRNDILNNRLVEDVSKEMESHPNLSRGQAANNVLNRKVGTYGNMPETYGLIQEARLFQTQKFSNEAAMSRQAFSEQQANARNAAAIAAEYRRLYEAPLPIQYTGQYFKYDPATKAIEPAPPTASLDDIRKGGYTHLSDAKMKGLSELDTANADFQIIRGLSEQLKNKSAIALQAGKASGGYVGSELGAQYDAARTRFGPVFDRLLGGTRAAASVPFANMITRTLPSFTDKPEVIDFKNNVTQILIDSLRDEKIRAAFGQPVNQDVLKRVKELGDELTKVENAQKRVGTALPASAATPPALPQSETGLPPGVTVTRRPPQ